MRLTTAVCRVITHMKLHHNKCAVLVAALMPEVGERKRIKEYAVQDPDNKR